MEPAAAVVVVESERIATSTAGFDLAVTGETIDDPPGWARLAATRGRERLPNRDLPRRSGYMLGTVVAGLIIGGLVVSAGWLAALTFGATATLLTLAVLRSPAYRRLRADALGIQTCRRAHAIRSQLLSQISEDDRRELERLCAMAEDVDKHGLAATQPHEADVTARLDLMLLSFVDRAVELRTVTSAFARTKGDVLEDEPGKTGRIIRLRRAARDACRRRIESLQTDLHEIGQAIRLVHEQTFAVGLMGDDDLHDNVDELLDEASRVLEAEREVAHGCEAANTS